MSLGVPVQKTGISAYVEKKKWYSVPMRYFWPWAIATFLSAIGLIVAAIVLALS